MRALNKGSKKGLNSFCYESSWTGAKDLARFSIA
jgi:hypothetical protein